VANKKRLGSFNNEIQVCTSISQKQIPVDKFLFLELGWGGGKRKGKIKR
jgi:hypothetical protein